LADSVTQGQLKRFLRKNGFVATGKNKNRYFGILKGEKRLVTFHYHKDSDSIPVGTLSAIAKQLALSKEELINMVKAR
jgi:hypothetical protein